MVSMLTTLSDLIAWRPDALADGMDLGRCGKHHAPAIPSVEFLSYVRSMAARAIVVSPLSWERG
jgi:hypothetical protein